MRGQVTFTEGSLLPCQSLQESAIELSLSRLMDGEAIDQILFNFQKQRRNLSGLIYKIKFFIVSPQRRKKYIAS